MTDFYFILVVINYDNADDDVVYVGTYRQEEMIAENNSEVSRSVRIFQRIQNFLVIYFVKNA